MNAASEIMEAARRAYQNATETEHERFQEAIGEIEERRRPRREVRTEPHVAYDMLTGSD